jgi:DNA-binding transcriptional regulator GbsR (MarR family)
MTEGLFVNEEFVGEAGIVFERSGLPRMAGRLLGRLLICDPPHQSTEQLCEALQVSKGSISTMTRHLIQIGLIERFGIPGIRHDYFRLKPDAWKNLIERGFSEQVKACRKVAEHGSKVVAEEACDKRKWLEEMRDFYVFLEQELPPLLERWENMRKKPHNSTSLGSLEFQKAVR